MTVFRLFRRKDFTVMSNHHFRNKRLSLKAMGLLSLMLFLPDEWDYTLKGLTFLCSDGIDSIRSAVNELEKFGYLDRHRIRNQKGQLMETEYSVYEVPPSEANHADTVPEADTAINIKRAPSENEKPTSEKPISEKPMLDNPAKAFPTQENPTQLNTYTSRTNTTSTYESITPSLRVQPKQEETDGQDGRIDPDSVRQEIREQIDYDLFDAPYSRQRVDELVELMLEVAVHRQPSFGLSFKNVRPTRLVQERFRSLTKEHIEMVLDSLSANTTKVRNTVLGKDISFRRSGDARSIRLSSVKGNYTKEALTAIIAGTKSHTPRRTKRTAEANRPSLIIDIDAKLQEGKGSAYTRWAGRFNLTQTAKTLSFLTEHKLLNYDELSAATESAKDSFNNLSEEIKAAEKRMAELSALKTQIINYARTRDVYVGYRKAGYSKRYLAEHESDILLHKAAKNYFDETGLKKLPTVKSLDKEYAELLQKKKTAYADYRKRREEMRELIVHKSNVDRILGFDNSTVSVPQKEQER